MNERKIAFIICTNSEVWCSECGKYLQNQELPDGIEMEVIPVYGAESMAAGYNKGMRQTDAKYKVYLHHDTFIVRRDFVRRVLDIFRIHPEVGILGVLGTDRMVQDASYWNHWSQGKIYACNVMQGRILSYSIGKDSELSYAMALDGMLLMTQYDVAWREDVFDEWDFYDVSQCFEFAKQGYKVAVMHEDEVSCLHDCGYSKLTRYDDNREKFCAEYAELGFVYNSPYTGKLTVEQQVLADEFLSCMDKLLAVDVTLACNMMEAQYHCFKNDNRIAMLKIVRDIFVKEQEEGVQKPFILQGCTCREIIDKYIKYKFMIRRIEFAVCPEAVEEMVSEIIEGKISVEALQEIIMHCCIDGEMVVDRLVNCRN